MQATNVLQDQLRFLGGLLARPKNVGAIAPSSPVLAAAIARQIDPGGDAPILELGPGTGIVTAALLDRGIAADRITAIEYDPGFAKLVASRFAKIRVLQGDAFDLAATLGPNAPAQFGAIVSGLPLLNFPPERRQALLREVFARLAPGAPFIQFSYGLHSPIAPIEGVSVKRAAFVWRNLPPARVWVYRRV